MKDDIGDIRDFYNCSVTMEDGRLQRHQLEYDITLRFFDKYLPPSARILEIGAATGAYTVHLARRGHSICAVDLSANLIEKCEEQVNSAGLQKSVSFAVADARDLSGIAESDYDAVLLMGPLYHLVEESDRLLVLTQSMSRLKPGGLVFSSMISRFGIMGSLLKDYPHWIEDQAEVWSLVEKGREPEDAPKGGFRGYFSTLSETRLLHESAGLQTLVFAGAEPAISADDESYNQLEGKRRELWLDLFFHISTEPSMVASSRHLLYIGRKPDRQRRASDTAE
ncbi:MAG: class I SAM-dependent methyltransferase [Candidatus Sabulitectum sp.]|nr:class I SAM-dependent methyltransferase [Candidatus Sabulitectum sp.]